MRKLKLFAPYPPTTESPYDYRKGGYHPVDVGDVFENRYLVHNKLAYGSFCTVWLVEDLLLKRFASLKVLTAEMSTKSSEKHVVEHLKAQQEQFDNHPGKEHVMQVYDAFTVVGPNGTHICIVAELLGISLAGETDAFHTLYPDEIMFFRQDAYKKMAAQVALGLAYLHKCGIIHGDLHIANILLYLPELQKASHKEHKELFGEPIPLPILYKDGSLVPPSDHRPRNLYDTKFSERLLQLCIEPPDGIHVKICDFGESSVYHTAIPTTFRMCPVFAAPEIIFKDISVSTFSMDIWSLGVVLCMIMNRKMEPFPEGVESMVKYIGKLPEKWRRKWMECNENGVCHEDGKRAGRRKWLSLGTEEDKTVFTDMIWKIFRYDPAERIDADEVARLIPHSWKQQDKKIQPYHLTLRRRRLVCRRVAPAQ